MNEWDPDQFFGQFTVMFLILWSIYCDVSNCDCNNIRDCIKLWFEALISIEIIM